jgi:hypothetical protein
LKPHEHNREVIAAAVVIVGNVKRLVGVANKMDDVLESLEPLPFRSVIVS